MDEEEIIYYIQVLESPDFWVTEVEELYTLEDAINFMNDILLDSNNKYIFRVMKQTKTVKNEEVYRTREI